ncbi:lyase family protein [Nocardioides sp. Kera G14]|uniref:lyase family protein n=1 Tax=Nocardioides sp. Kera G14 TaxID=2884264 RepID=UPI001D11C0AC|nr:lyase family protein [Nocardioides sp. Kera G14]UDY23428.1 3-carboxy-cis,cis-muconate cycloisomerase [Nocardioides sp. Kera G14]
MSDLFWPGDERAGDLLTESAWLAAMVAVEQAWLDALAESGVAPSSAWLSGVVGHSDVKELARGAEAGGNPVLDLAKLLRARSGNDWIHRGLTSQDVVDSALMLCLRDTVETVRRHLDAQVEALVSHIEAHRRTLMAGRTLAQHAVPITFGLKAATWLTAVLDARESLAALRFPAQIGGAAGTLAAAAALGGETTAGEAGRSGGTPAGSPAVTPALGLAERAATALGLEARPPWHTSRRPITAVGDALTATTDACGRIAADVITLSRTEIGELSEPAGRGGSSTMPHKRNPALSVLIRRAALTSPGLNSTLHLAAALSNDERPDGAWHAEWATLRDLGRRTAVAASQTAELLTGLVVHADRMAATVAAHHDDLLAEQDSITAFAGAEPASDPDYLGETDRIIDAVLARADALTAGQRAAGAPSQADPPAVIKEHE